MNEQLPPQMEPTQSLFGPDVDHRGPWPLVALSLTQPWATLVACGAKRVSLSAAAVIRGHALECPAQKVDDLAVQATVCCPRGLGQGAMEILWEPQGDPYFVAHGVILHHIDTIAARHHNSVVKNGRALQGHRRVTDAVGRPPARRRPPSGGYNVRCICGWDGGNRGTSTEARTAYRKHLDHEIDHVPRRCKRCGREQPLSAMRPDNRHLCRDCSSQLGNLWSRRHPKASARHKRNHHLLMRFGITADEADLLLEEQGGVCAICSQSIADKRGYEGHIDHDHATGKVRGVLCFHCNAGLGQFGDDVERLKLAIGYLEKHAQ